MLVQNEIHESMHWTGLGQVGSVGRCLTHFFLPAPFPDLHMHSLVNTGV